MWSSGRWFGQSVFTGLIGIPVAGSGYCTGHWRPSLKLLWVDPAFFTHRPARAAEWYRVCLVSKGPGFDPRWGQRGFLGVLDSNFGSLGLSYQPQSRPGHLNTGRGSESAYSCSCPQAELEVKLAQRFFLFFMDFYTAWNGGKRATLNNKNHSFGFCREEC